MSRSDAEVEFELVQTREERSSPGGSTEDPLPHADVEALGSGAEPSADVQADPIRAFEQERFPLAGPILSSSQRELKGRCTGCDSRLRIRVRSEGTVKVRCPICGRTKRIRV